MATRKRISEHFTIEEFDCNDGTHVPEGYVPALKKLCEVYLEPLRKKFGSCTVHSGYRTRSWNTQVGGASASFHIYTDRKRGDGIAADVEFARGSVDDWRDEAVRLRAQRKDGRGNGGIGYYPRGGFIHVDTRDYPANWDGP